MPRTATTGRKGALLAAVLLAISLLVVPLPQSGPRSAAAQTIPDEAKSQLEKGKRSLEETRRRESGLERDVEMLESERTRINRNLIDTAKHVQRGEAKLSEIEARLSELEAQEKMVRGSLEQNQDKIAKLLAAMQRMGRNPPPVMVTRREDALQMVRSAMLLASVFPDLREQALVLSEKLGELVRVMGDIRKEGDQLRAETQRMADARLRLDTLVAEKRNNINERQGELRNVRKAAAELARSISDLDELIVKLDKTISEQGGIEAYNRELAEAEAAAHERVAAQSQAQNPLQSQTQAQVPGPRQSAPPTQLPPPVVGREPQKTEPAKPTETALPNPTPAPPQPGIRTAMINPGRLEPGVPFTRLKGNVPMPAAGRRVVAFGDRTEVGGTSKGTVLETRPGAQITSPSDGWVVFASEFRSYGQLLIINGGGGYHIVLAGLTRVDVTVGQFVLAGEPVGVMGSASPQLVASGVNRTAAKASDTPPALYIELRKDGRPIDPDPWWAAEPAQKAQG